MNIRTKLILYFLVPFLVTFITIMLIINTIISNDMEESAINSTLQSIRQANVNVENSLRNTENIINLVSRERQIFEFLNFKDEDDMAATSKVVSDIRIFLYGITEFYPEIKGIGIISKNDLLLSNEMYRIVNEPLIEEDWYKECVENPNSLIIKVHPLNRNLTHHVGLSSDQTISLLKSIIDPATGQPAGIVIADMSTNFIEKNIVNIQHGKKGFIYFIDKEGKVVYSPINYIVPRVNPEWFKDKSSGIFEKTIQDDKLQFIYETSGYTDFKIVGVFSLEETLRQVQAFRNILIVILSFVTIFSIGFAMFISSSIAKPIRKLRELMKRAENGDFTTYFNVQYHDEIGQLGKSFNTMITEIKNLINIVFKEQRSKRKLELIALQSQINPHFLYNTFDTIHWMLKKYGAKDVMEVIQALTDLFRISLSSGREIIKLSEEIKHVASYLKIQKVRYEDMMEYEIHMEDDAGDLFIPKIILQPLVENAIYHGIKNKNAAGRIWVHAKIDEERLIVTVEDDGVGIPDDKLNEINDALKAETGSTIGYGLYNVNKRISLAFGKEYGLHLTHSNKGGTLVTVKMPVIRTLEVSENEL
jgi:two-component system sensor histidine kinase YesM